MLHFHKSKKIGRLALLIFTLILFNKLSYGQTETNLKIQNFRLTVKSPVGGICQNKPQAYGYNGFTGFGNDPKNVFINNIKNSPFLKEGFESIPKEKYFRAKARQPLQLDLSYFVPDTLFNGQFCKAQPLANVIGHVGYSTPDGFVTKRADPFINKDFELGWIGVGNGMSNQGSEITVLFDKASTDAFIVITTTIRFTNNLNQEVARRQINVMMPFVVEGIVDQAVDSLGLVTEPQIPYMVLHDPPGDGSFTVMEKAKTVCRSLETSFANDESNNTNASLKLGYAGSVGVIVVVDIEVYVEFSGSLSIGDFKMQSKSNETCLTLSKSFATSDANGFKDGGDLFVGYGYDVAYGVYRQIVIDNDSCKARIEKNLVYRPIRTPESIREFALDEAGILLEIEKLQKLEDDTSLPIKTRADAQNQIKVWQQVLDLNEKNKSTASVSIDPNVSFSGNTGGYTQTKSMEVTETNTIAVEHYIGATAGLQGVVNIGGSGFSAGYEYATEKRFGKTTSQTNADATVLTYTLKDAHGGDKFNVDVLRDRMYGTPVFKLKDGTISSCPYEGGYQRDQPKLKHDGNTNDYIISQGNPVGSSASFKIDLCNESNEDRTYNLKLNATTNLNGAVVSASGVPLNGNDQGQVYNIPKNSCLQDLIVEVKQLSANSPKDYPNLELFLFSDCDPDISSSVFASVYFGALSGVNDQTDDSLLSVFPNPASGFVNINLLEGQNISSVRLIDGTGRLVRNESGIGNASHQINISNLPSGIYSIQVQSGKHLFVRKLVVE